MTSAPISSEENRLRSIINDLSPSDPRFNQLVLELAELLETLGRVSEAGDLYKLSLSSREAFEEDERQYSNAPYRPKLLRAVIHTLSRDDKTSLKDEAEHMEERRLENLVVKHDSTSAQDMHSEERQLAALGVNNESSSVLDVHVEAHRLDSLGLNEESSSAKEAHGVEMQSEGLGLPDESSLAQDGHRVERLLEGLGLKDGSTSAQEPKQPDKVASKRPARQLFKPKAQVQAEERAAEERRQRERLRDEEEQKLAREKEAREQEAIAQAKKRQDVLLRASQQQSTPQQQPLSKSNDAPWSRSKDRMQDRNFEAWDDTSRRWRTQLGSSSEGDFEDVRAIPYDGRHILEVVGIKTTDEEADIKLYLRAIKDFAISPNIRWADSTHALAVFSDILAAQSALEGAPEEGRLWLKPYAKASPICRMIKACELQPPAPPVPRPETTSVVARRLVEHALQNSGIRDLSGEKELRERRKAKLAEKARKQQLRDAAWGDDDPEDE